MTRGRALILVVVLAGLSLVTAYGLMTNRAKTPPPTGSPGSSESPSGSPAASQSTGGPPPATSTFEDGGFGPTLTHGPTAGQAQSRVWVNDGLWWALLVDPESQELRIARLDWASQRWVDTGTLVDERLHAVADALWDGTQLTVVSTGNKPTQSGAARINRFRYDKASQRYAIEPDFPITITATGVDEPVLARDTTGLVWLTYIDHGALVVRHTVANAYHWTPRLALTLDGAQGSARASTLTVDGKGIALVWNNLDENVLRVAVHADGSPDTTWTESSTAVDGLKNSKSGLSARSETAASGSRLFVAFETAYDTTVASNPLAPGAVVMVLDGTGTWANIQLGRVRDHLGVPILAIDSQHRMLYAVAAIASTGQIVYKRSSLDHLGFESGRGDPLVSSTTDAAIRNPTTTKQDVDTTAGLVVLGADDTTGRYLHGVLVTDGPAPTRGTPPPPPVAPVANVVIHDTFDPWAIGQRSPAGWIASSQGGVGQLTVGAGISATNHALRLTTTSALGGLRACKSFPASTAGVVTVSELVRIGGIGGSDATLGSLRGPGGETASLRVTRHGLLAYYNGAAKVLTTVPIRAGAWYRLTIVIRVATKTYDATLVTGGKVVARLGSVHWRDAIVPAVDTVCVQTPGSGRGATIIVDDVVVRR